MKNQFRRFTYLITSENNSFSEVLEQLNSEEIQQKLKEVGILSFEVYKKENDFFLLIDTVPTLHSLSMNSALKSINSDIDFQHVFQKENLSFSFENSPLERIYKFEQKKVYNSKEGQLKTDIGAKKRFVWTLLLEENPELMAEYKRVHSMGQAWPEITNNMKQVGVKDMEIYLSGTQAILIMDTIPDFNLEEIGPKWQKLPREEEWQTYVAKFQRTNPNSSIQEKWQDMLPV
ncbi:L-rhamnose mutarotase [Lutibacter oricola]|uniref:L-rhamnose mutarotase n=1 Tax=Lutibacter oricola TaxID=762486 RepID=A0A1H3DSJ6_9FLAO|nr:L-rhamnose mutarotase [Lutibacter oricola]SDX69376.1 L-rhamnose mutarotase [Lutibacter oricola]